MSWSGYADCAIDLRPVIVSAQRWRARSLIDSYSLIDFSAARDIIESDRRLVHYMVSSLPASSFPGNHKLTPPADIEALGVRAARSTTPASIMTDGEVYGAGRRLSVLSYGEPGRDQRMMVSRQEPHQPARRRLRPAGRHRATLSLLLVLADVGAEPSRRTSRSAAGTASEGGQQGRLRP